jgi:tRNA dimethylallyltransferase
MKELQADIFSEIIKAPADYDMLCILGPTASGKTKFAVECAKKITDAHLKNKRAQCQNIVDKPLVAEIISADSRQVYKGMDIGTGKDLEEYAGVPYHLIDIVEAGEKYNVFKYKQDFQRVYDEVIARGAFPILCGGSGLYIEAVCTGYELKEVAPNPELRAELEKKEMPELIQMLTELKARNGSEPHNNTDFDSKKRVIRAIEIERAAAAGRSEKSGTCGENSEGIENAVGKSVGTKIKVKYIGLNPDREVRNARIDNRLQQRLDCGMVDEVKKLLDSGIKAEDLIYYGLEYKFVTQYIVGELSFDEMKEKLSIAIHQFAKRQMTWFRGMERRGIKIEWLKV